MFKKISVIAITFAVCVSAFAQSRRLPPLPPPPPSQGHGGGNFSKADQLRRMSQRLNQQIQMAADYMSPNQQNDLIQALDRAMQISSPQGGTGNGVACEMFGPGSYNGFRYTYRGGYNANAVFGTDDLNQAMTKLDELSSAGLCSYAQSDCTLVGAGSFNGFKYTYILASEGQAGMTPIFAHDNLQSVLSAFDTFAQKGLCRPQGASCDLAGAGSFNGFNYSSRLTMNGEVVFGHDSQSVVLSTLQNLRSRGLCR